MIGGKKWFVLEKKKKKKRNKEKKFKLGYPIA